MNNISELLTASSILTAIISSFYSLNLTAINKYIETTPKIHKIENKANYLYGIEIKNTKVILLLLNSIIFGLIFIPDTCNIIVDSYYLICTQPYDKLQYDAIKASFVIVTIFMNLLSISIIYKTIKFFIHHKKLNYQ